MQCIIIWKPPKIDKSSFIAQDDIRGFLSKPYCYPDWNKKSCINP